MSVVEDRRSAFAIDCIMYWGLVLILRIDQSAHLGQLKD